MPKLRAADGGKFTFRCPGCNGHHMVNSGWSLTGGVDKPTLTPSVLIRSGHYASAYVAGEPCWCTFNAAEPGRALFTCYLCHLFVVDGKIQFLRDCTHALAGQTVDMLDV